jgi:hypothetical protein
LPSSLISPALERVQDLSRGDRALLAAQCPSLAECLASVPDPRDPRGVRHTLTSLLLAAVAAVLACLGVRRDPLAGRFEPPDEATIRRVLETVDADALDTAVGAWLAGWLHADCGQPGCERALAVDGKAVRGTRYASEDGQALHLLAAADQQATAVLAQARVDGKANECVRPGGHPGEMKWSGAHRARSPS